MTRQPTCNTTTPGSQSSPTPIVDLNLTDPPADRANVCGLAVLRLAKAAVATSITAGRELASIAQAQGADFDTMITTRTMLNVAEAKTLIAFAAQPGLQPDRLTPAVAVPFSQVLRAVAMLGDTYMAKVNQGEPELGDNWGGPAEPHKLAGDNL